MAACCQQSHALPLWLLPRPGLPMVTPGGCRQQWGGTVVAWHGLVEPRGDAQGLFPFGLSLCEQGLELGLGFLSVPPCPALLSGLLGAVA